MIRGTSGVTETPNIEHMMISGTTNPESNIISLSILREDLEDEDKLIYDNAVSILSGKVYTIVDNTLADLDITRITSENVEEGENIFDFLTLNQDDRDKLVSFLNLAIRLS